MLCKPLVIPHHQSDKHCINQTGQHFAGSFFHFRSCRNDLLPVYKKRWLQYCMHIACYFLILNLDLSERFPVIR
ncbi:MAG TPA: hypothetical protein DCG51_00455 [Erysipelotrichaceae bacterium]|nr:hypothetical protein [Erysipelotrichaceae bacterium]